MTAAATYPDPLALLQADRDQLTHLLRGLAARLDQLDRQLTNLAWHGSSSQVGMAIGEMTCDRAHLESERDRLSDRLTLLAGELNALDGQLNATGNQQAKATGRVGTCPYCGYPSLGSGLCAFCRPHLAR